MPKSKSGKSTFSKQNLQIMGGISGALLIIVIVLVVLFWFDIIPGGSTPPLPTSQPFIPICDNSIQDKRSAPNNDCGDINLTDILGGSNGKNLECGRHFVETTKWIAGQKQLGNKCRYDNTAGKCISDGNDVRVDGC